MRKIVREDTIATVAINVYEKGTVLELERMGLPGISSEDMAIKKGLKISKKKYPNRNVFCGDVEIKRFRFELSPYDFVRYAKQTEIN